MQEHKLLLVGCGKMGKAMLDGIINAGWPKENIHIIDPITQDIAGVKFLQSFDSDIITSFAPEVILFAVKPQLLEEILADYKLFTQHSVIISIVAGKTTACFNKHLGAEAAVIRTMPNLPMIIGKGVVAWFKNSNVSDKHERLLHKIFSPCASMYEVKDEFMLDAITAISGSGPAYVFHFMECLVKSAVELGLEEELAIALVTKTIEGSLDLARGPGTLSQLREQVTSPNGTTEAALQILMENEKLQGLLQGATKAACLRSKELSQ